MENLYKLSKGHYLNFIFRFNVKIYFMRNRFIFLIICFTILTNTLFAQENNYCNDFHLGDNINKLHTYDSIQQKNDLERVLNTQIMIAERINLLNLIATYNCDNQYGLKADCILDDLKNEYFNKIIGEWNWNASVLNAYGIHKETSESCECKRILNISKEVLTITQNDSIVYQSTISIIGIKGKENNQVSLKIQTNDGFYDFRDSRNFQEITFSTKLHYFLGLPLELLKKENYEFLMMVQLGQHNPIEIYSRGIY